MNFGTSRFADVRHRIHEREPRGEECICCVLGEFGCSDVSDDHRSTEHVVELTESATNYCLTNPYQNSIGMKKVGNCAAFAQELRIRRDVYVVAGDDRPESICSTDRNC